MTTAPLRRLAAGATTALLAPALLAPAAGAFADEAPLEDQTTTILEEAPAASHDPRLAQTGAEITIPAIALVAVLLAAGATLLATRRLGGR